MNLGNRSSFRIALCASLILSMPPVAGSGTERKGLDPGDKVKDLLVRSEGRHDEDAGSRGLDSLVSDAGIIVLVVIGGMLFVLLWLKRRGFRGQTGARGAIEIVGRLALSPRHWLYLVRVGGRQVLVGVSGDRIARVMDFGEDGGGMVAVRSHDNPQDSRYGAPQTGAGEDDDHGRGRRRSPGGGNDLLGEHAISDRDSSPAASDPGSLDAELAAYRQQVTRLQSLLQNWRDKLPWREKETS